MPDLLKPKREVYKRKSKSWTVAEFTLDRKTERRGERGIVRQVSAVWWLSDWCQGLNVPRRPTKFGHSRDYSRGRKAWMTSVRLLGSALSFLSLCLNLSPAVFASSLTPFLSPSSSHRQSLLSVFFGTVTLSLFFFSPSVLFGYTLRFVHTRYLWILRSKNRALHSWNTISTTGLFILLSCLAPTQPKNKYQQGRVK